MGIINRTNDSFFAGNRHADLDSAKRALDEAVDAGADIVDIGGVRAGQEGEPSSARRRRSTASCPSSTTPARPTPTSS